MKLQLNRVFIGKDYTIGHLSVDGIHFCDTLEDIPRVNKIPKKTCIPKGVYKMVLNFSNRFQRVMPRILNVPNFDGILVHWGNSSIDTDGCILVGKNTKTGWLSESRITFDKLFSTLTDAEILELEITGV